MTQNKFTKLFVLLIIMVALYGAYTELSALTMTKDKQAELEARLKAEMEKFNSYLRLFTGEEEDEAQLEGEIEELP